jgi:hypothetical protein
LKTGFNIILLALTLQGSSACAQMITGVWKGKINRQKAELKIVQVGDSITGTSYYYESPNNYRRYSIRGYRDAETNEVVWWDDQLIDEKSGRINLSAPGRIPLLARADFNCPGGGKMMLDGKVGKIDEDNPTGTLHLDKTEKGTFPDEWDDVIVNYLSGGNDRDFIDSIGSIAKAPRSRSEQEIKQAEPVPAKDPPTPIAIVQPETPKPQTVIEKFQSRKKVFNREIPVTGDSIELRFYDNAEIDGDSISLFLGDKLIFEHIRLTDKAYTIKLAVTDLPPSAELTMVAENLGSIPPNTSYMVVLVGDKRYDARLESTEGSSAMVRFVKPGEK